MTDPTFDAEGYPTEETLTTIREWPTTTLSDMVDCMDFAGRAWSYPDYWHKDPDWHDPERPVWWKPETEVRYVFSTGGWSGNESIIAAIEANMMVQMIGAWSWRRGGHYEYRFPIDPEEKPCDYCDEGDPVVDGWHIRVDPEGIDPTARVPCPRR
jgi:hypothetical protein